MSTILKSHVYISKIILTNYRTFLEENIIELSPQPDKPITIIHGENGEGKTTLLKAIHWCLYGKERKHSKISVDPEGIVSKSIFESLNVGQTKTTSVQLWIYEENSPLFRIKRTITTTKNPGGGRYESNSTNFASTLSNFSLEEVLDFSARNPDTGELVPIKNRITAETQIEKQFPPILSEYILFDAELLGVFENKKEDKLIEEGIREITGLPVLDHANEHINKFHNKLEREMSKGDAGLGELIAEKSDYLKTKEENEAKIIRLEIPINEKQDELDQISDKLSKNSEQAVKEKEEELKNVKVENNQIKLKLTKANDEFLSFIQDNLYKSYLKKPMIEATRKFDQYQTDGLIPPNISKDALEQIITSNPHICTICDATISEGSKAWAKITDMKNKLIDSITVREISSGRGKITNMLLDINKQQLLQKFQKLKSDILEYRRMIKEKNDQQKKYEDFFRIHDLKEIRRLGLRRDDLKKDRDELIEDKGECKRLIKFAVENLSEIQPKIQARESIQTKNTDDVKKKQIANMISTVLVIVKSELLNDFKEIAEKRTGEHFLKIAPRKEDFSGVKIQNNFSLSALDDDGNPKNLSMGQAHTLGLSYLTAIREIMKKNYFMIIDSPLHNIDQDVRIEFAQRVTEYSPGTQITLLVTDAEYTGTAKKKIVGAVSSSVRDIFQKNNVVWREYILDVERDKSNKVSRTKIRELVVKK